MYTVKVTESKPFCCFSKFIFLHEADEAHLAKIFSFFLSPVKKNVGTQ